MEKYKIVHIYKTFNVYNGLIEILSILANSIDRDRFELIACVNEYEENEFGEKFKKSGGIIESLSIKNKWYNEPNALIKLYMYLQKTKPCIVQTHVLKANLLATLVARAAKVPVVIATEMTLKDIAPTPLRRLRDQILQQFTSYSISKCDRFIVTSEYIKNEWCNKHTLKKTEIVYPPFNLEKYNSAVKIKDNKKKYCNQIGFVGRLSEEKSVITLIKSMEIVNNKLPDIKCRIVGTGPIESELKNYVSFKNLQKCIEFTGYKANPFESLKEMDIFVLTSRTEGCPIVILEAMAMGLPVIATDVGGNKELVTHDITGILIPVNNPEMLASSIEKLVKNKKMAEEMGREGKKIAFSKFHPSSFTARLQSLYNELIKEKVNLLN